QADEIPIGTAIEGAGYLELCHATNIVVHGDTDAPGTAVPTAFYVGTCNTRLKGMRFSYAAQNPSVQVGIWEPNKQIAPTIVLTQTNCTLEDLNFNDCTDAVLASGIRHCWSRHDSLDQRRYERLVDQHGEVGGLRIRNIWGSPFH